MNNYPSYAKSTEKNDLTSSPAAPIATSKCQIHYYQEIAQPISTWQILWQFRNRLKRFGKRRLHYFQYYWRKLFGKEDDMVDHSELLQKHLQAGDRVRIKSKREILLLLDSWQEQKGCGFMEEMWTYCGTEQVVRKRVEKFLDEATLRMRTSKGIVILENLMCEGTVDFGRCDRSCFYFWREEWLEKIK